MQEGTWKTTGGGFDLSSLVGPAVFVGVAVAAAMIVMEFMWWIIAVGVIAVAGRLYVLHRKHVNLATIAAAFAREHQILEAKAAQALMVQRQHELAVAAASAPQVNITNTIDPAAMLEMAARVAAGQQWGWRAEPAPVPRREVGR